ncbi:UBX domain-containing protein 1 isoform X2 [Callorhinchus milii]|uniref:UBX domain-containing protein 1 isoform X2 n=1 Tax=Callorhinchus milii TaxID=7868 RepID=UPI001C3FE742|nr:UBX domain-containing protein 1 isoform X2 [Callorhinchus milii]
MAEMSALETMMDMGFSRNRAEKALLLSGNQGIEKAMDWLMEHEDDPNLDEPYLPPEGCVLPPPPEKPIGEPAELTLEEQIKQNASLSEEEKKEQLRRLEELMKQRQQEREEREKKDEIEREKARRRQGQELAMIRQRLQEEEMRKVAEDRRREKLEDIRARQRVREKIERDKAERALKFGGGVAAASPPVPVIEPIPPSPQSQSTKREYEECRLQIRLLDGSQITQTFRTWEQLAAVRLYVELNQKGAVLEPFNLMTSFPRKVFTEEDMEKPLQELGLVPSAVLIVCKK